MFIDSMPKTGSSLRQERNVPVIVSLLPERREFYLSNGAINALRPYGAGNAEPHSSGAIKKRKLRARALIGLVAGHLRSCQKRADKR